MEALGPRARLLSRTSSENVEIDQKSNISPSHHRLLNWDELPEWQRDNEYILTSYRPATHSIKACLRSVFALHNDTINIHSHLFGSILFFALPFAAYNGMHGRYPKTRMGDILVFSAFFFGVAICFLLSATFHTVANHSPRIAAFGNQLDYLGIVILMWGSTIPTVYYGFCNNPELQKTYWSVVTLLAAFCVVATLSPKFRTPTFRPYRAAMYAGLGLSALVFITHGLILYGWHTQNRYMSLNWMILMATFNLVGAAIYAARIPEKLYPKTCDLFGSSHQILHMMVIFAGLAHMEGLFKAFDHVHGDYP